jgi:hypothetical protein
MLYICYLIAKNVIQRAASVFEIRKVMRSRVQFNLVNGYVYDRVIGMNLCLIFITQILNKRYSIFTISPTDVLDPQ